MSSLSHIQLRCWTFLLFLHYPRCFNIYPGERDITFYFKQEKPKNLWIFKRKDQKARGNRIIKIRQRYWIQIWNINDWLTDQFNWEAKRKRKSYQIKAHWKINFMGMDCQKMIYMNRNIKISFLLNILFYLI